MSVITRNDNRTKAFFWISATLLLGNIPQAVFTWFAVGEKTAEVKEKFAAGANLFWFPKAVGRGN